MLIDAAGMRIYMNSFLCGLMSKGINAACNFEGAIASESIVSRPQ